MTKAGIKNIIATNHSGYPTIRNISGLQLPSYSVKKVADPMKPFAYSYFKLFNKSHPYFSNLFYDLGSPHKLFHFFNAINIGKKPWITTYEHYLPRGAHQYGQYDNEKRYIDFALGKIASPNCRKLIALSNFALEAQKRYLNNYGNYYDEIIPKIQVLHPSQKLIISDFKEKETDERFITSTLVGGDFFRKGGLEILNVFERLLNEKAPLKLNIISSMRFGDYASRSTKEDVGKALNIINKFPDNITHKKYLPNEQVIKLLCRSDIGLLPSYAETYGYSVLEAQACGCAVISTDGAALVEINNDEMGWLINTFKNDDGRTIPRSDAAKKQLSETIEERTYEIFKKLVSNPNEIKEKGKKSILHIKENHSPQKAAQTLEEIYNQSADWE